MKNQILLMLFTTLLSFNLMSQTNLSGTLFNDTTLDLAGSPYNVVGIYGVPSGITLTIEKGVEINITFSHQIVIEGSLIANGTGSQRIIFNGNSGIAPMLLFKDSNLDLSELSFITFNGPKKGIKLSEDSNDNNTGILQVDNINLFGTSIETNGYNSDSEIHISNSTLKNSEITGMYPLSDVIRINNSYIKSCNVTSDNYNQGIFIADCNSVSTKYKMGCCGANITIENSDVKGSKFSLPTNGSSGWTAVLTLDDCNLSNPRIILPIAKVNINNCALNFSTDFATDIAVKIGSGSISNSSFIADGTQTAIQRGPGTTTIHNPKILSVQNNTFYGFENNVVVPESIGGTGQVYVRYNDFLDENTTYHVANYHHNDVIANDNYWSTNDMNQVYNYIYDYWDNITLGEVLFSPSNLISCNAGNSFSNNWVGTSGDWNDKNNWSRFKVPTICDNVYIPANASVSLSNNEVAICNLIFIEEGAGFQMGNGTKLVAKAVY